MASQGIRGEASLENEAGESHPQAGLGILIDLNIKG